jgi:choline dehydrogenase-like flavoprotein
MLRRDFVRAVVSIGFAPRLLLSQQTANPARMGDDPKHSVLSKWCQSHDHKNLFVVDGASFTSAGWQNPTMTIVALSMRASEYLAGEKSKQNI